MDPQSFIKVSIGSLGVWKPGRSPSGSSSEYSCEIRLRGLPTLKAAVPLLPSREAALDIPAGDPVVFYLAESDLQALMAAPACLRISGKRLQLSVYKQSGGSQCGLAGRRRKVGTCLLSVGPQWAELRPAIVHSGWVDLRRRWTPAPELHLRVKLEPDPRYVFQFEDETKLSPQVVLLRGGVRQPIFTCKFSRERRHDHHSPPPHFPTRSPSPAGSCWSSSSGGAANCEASRRERKGWRVVVYDLSGSAVAAAFMATPFVPSTGSDRVAQSNPGAWLVLRAAPAGPPESWHPWGRLEAWRERGAAGRESICCRLLLLADGPEDGVQISEVRIAADRGGEFFIDMDRHRPGGAAPSGMGAAAAGGFVMNCRVQGEGRSSKPLVQLALRHVTCVEDAAIFMALAAAVDLSVRACQPFSGKGDGKGKKMMTSSDSPSSP